MDDSTDLSEWTPRRRPGGSELIGTRVVLQPLDWSQHGDSLFDAIAGENNLHLWRYIPFGPFTSRVDFEKIFDLVQQDQDWETMVILSAENRHALGMASYMRIREGHGSAEIGCVVFGEALKRTPEATEALTLMARHIFDDLGYRRYEWKCDDANEASKRAAERFGYRFEGVFRNDMIIKGVNRDTAWYSIVDREWADVASALGAWLAPRNFDAGGKQVRRLEDLRG